MSKSQNLPNLSPVAIGRKYKKFTLNEQSAHEQKIIKKMAICQKKINKKRRRFCISQYLPANFGISLGKEIIKNG